MNFVPELTLKKNKSSVQFNSNENGKLVNLLNNIPLNNLKNYYDLETSFFMKNCEKLNFDFFTKIEQINFIPNNYNNLFIILIKEICLLIEEIERLNLQLREKTFSKEEKSKKIYPKKLNFINVNTNNKLKIKSSKNLSLKENFDFNKKIIEKNNNFSINNNNNNFNLDLVNKGLEKCQKELENLTNLENLILTNFQNNNNNNNNNNKNKNNNNNKNLNYKNN